MPGLTDYGFELDDEGRAIGVQSGKAARLLDWEHKRGLREFRALTNTLAVKRLMAQRRAAGLCVYCGIPAAPKSECQGCAERRAQWRRDRVAAGYCGCGKRSAPGAKRCRGCIDRKARKRETARASGLCSSCLRRRPESGKLCRRCIDISRRAGATYRARLAAQGKCERCKGPNDTAATRCNACKAKRRKGAPSAR